MANTKGYAEMVNLARVHWWEGRRGRLERWTSCLLLFNLNDLMHATLVAATAFSMAFCASSPMVQNRCFRGSVEFHTRIFESNLAPLLFGQPGKRSAWILIELALHVPNHICLLAARCPCALSFLAVQGTGTIHCICREIRSQIAPQLWCFDLCMLLCQLRWVLHLQSSWAMQRRK